MEIFNADEGFFLVPRHTAIPDRYSYYSCEAFRTFAAKSPGDKLGKLLLFIVVCVTSLERNKFSLESGPGRIKFSCFPHKKNFSRWGRVCGLKEEFSGRGFRGGIFMKGFRMVLEVVFGVGLEERLGESVEVGLVVGFRVGF